MPAAASQRARLLEIYATLDETYRGETWHWMPHAVYGPFDVIVGAVLVQHTSWANAERALAAMRAAGALDAGAIARMPDEALADLVRVSGTPRVKARRLRAVAATVQAAGGLPAFLALPAAALRERLLATHGVGAETADAIALYAAGHPVFVIDAYTRRMFRRIGLGPERDGYRAWQHYFESALPADTELYRRYHACIVLHSKALCRATPRCAPCPLRDRCATGGAAA